MTIGSNPAGWVPLFGMIDKGTAERNALREGELHRWRAQHVIIVFL
jgi:hypothetical protein